MSSKRLFEEIDSSSHYDVKKLKNNISNTQNLTNITNTFCQTYGNLVNIVNSQNEYDNYISTENFYPLYTYSNPETEQSIIDYFKGVKVKKFGK